MPYRKSRNDLAERSVVSPLLSAFLIVLSYGLGHLLVRLHDKSAHVIAVLAMVDLAGVAACFQIEFRAAADRADLKHFFGLHDYTINALRC